MTFKVIIKVIAVLAVLGGLTFATNKLLDPVGIINAEWDNRRVFELDLVSQAFTLYADDHEGNYPTLSEGKPIPEVTAENVLESGAILSAIQGIQDYLNFVPKDPTGGDYRAGVLTNGRILLGTTDSRGTPLLNGL